MARNKRRQASFTSSTVSAVIPPVVSATPPPPPPSAKRASLFQRFRSLITNGETDRDRERVDMIATKAVKAQSVTSSVSHSNVPDSFSTAKRRVEEDYSVSSDTIVYPVAPVIRRDSIDIVDESETELPQLAAIGEVWFHN